MGHFVKDLYAAWHEKYNILIFDEIDSTNSEAMRIARTNPSNNYVIVAKNQIKSRGKNGKVWYSDFGNLYFSLLLNINASISIFPQFSFITSLALYDSIEYFALESKKSLNIALKWPNDVLIDNKKLSGILLESISLENINYLIIGVGVNITLSLTNIQQLTTNLLHEGIIIDDPKQLLDVFMINFEKYFIQWMHEGFVNIRKYWLSKAYKLNNMVTINDGKIEIYGMFKSIDSDGSIILQLDSGLTHVFSAGEVFFGKI